MKRFLTVGVLRASLFVSFCGGMEEKPLTTEKDLEGGLLVSFHNKENESIETIMLPKEAISLFNTLKNLKEDIQEDEEEAIPLGIPTTRSAFSMVRYIAHELKNPSLSSKDAEAQFFESTLEFPNDKATIQRYLDELLLVHYLDAPQIESIYLHLFADIIRYQTLPEKRYELARFIAEQHPDISIAIANVLNVSECMQVLQSTQKSTVLSPPQEEYPTSIGHIAFNFDGSLLAATDEAMNQVDLFKEDKQKNWELIQKIGVSSLYAGPIAFGPNNLLATSDRGAIYLWKQELEKWIKHKSFPIAKGRVITSLAFNPTENELVAGTGADGSQGLILSWKLNEKGEWQLQELEERYKGLVESVSFNAQGTLLAAGSYDTTIRLFKKNENGSWQLFQILNDNTSPVTSVALDFNGKVLASGNEEGKICIWSQNADGEWKLIQETGVKTKDKKVESIKSLAFDPLNNILASAHGSQIIIWKIGKDGVWEQWYSLEGHTEAVNSLSFKPDGQLLASGSNDGTVRLWPFYDKKINEFFGTNKLELPLAVLLDFYCSLGNKVSFKWQEFPEVLSMVTHYPQSLQNLLGVNRINEDSGRADLEKRALTHEENID